MLIKEADKEQHLVQVLSLLGAASLPTEGVEEHFGDFLVAVNASGKVVGAIGMERYHNGTGLLRSAVVEPSLRNAGVGSRLFEELIKRARSSGIRQVILLTTTAEQYFARKGFRTVPRCSITGPVTTSAEFAGACPASAVCMEMVLEPT